MSEVPAPLQTDDPQERSDLVRQMFDRLFERYDLNNSLLSLGMDHYWRWKARRILQLPRDARVLDLCCGTGALTRCLAQVVPDGEVVGVDFSEGMLTPARNHKTSPGSGKIRYLQSDVLSLPFQAHEFDAVTLAFGPRNIVDLDRLWQEIRRVAKPGGQVLSLELTRPKGILGVFHDIYLNYVVPFVGGIVSGDAEAYRYLSRTIAGFLDPAELAQSMQNSNLSDVTYRPLSGGIVNIHHARTPI